jgi:Fe-S cluster assembly protein SufD
MADRRAGAGVTATSAPVRPAPASGEALLRLVAERPAAAEPEWLLARRRAAADQFASTGLPTAKWEDWRFTPVQPLASIPFRLPDGGATVTVDLVERLECEVRTGPLIVLVDGRVAPELCRMPPGPGGVALRPLADAIAAGDPVVERHLGAHAVPTLTPFGAMNLSLFADGAVLHVPARTAVDVPVHVMHIATGAAARCVVSPRLLVVLDEGASALLIESYAALDGASHLTNAVGEIALGAGARLQHVRLQREPETAWHIGLTQVVQRRDSRYRSVTLALGSRLARHDLRTALAEPGAEALFYGLYLSDHEQLVDNHTMIHHQAPHCNSWEVYKGVLADRSHAVFNGKVVVDADAQQTDAKQTNRNLLLSDRARVNTKPQLEIFADDVKCTHGATVGRIDEQQRYYVQSRGIAGRAARALLVWAFAAEVLAEIPDPSLRAALERMVHAQLDALIE